MLKPGKKAKDSRELNGSLTLTAADGALGRIFDTPVVDSLRHMTTDLACTGGVPARIAVVSALQGEGVTSTVLALATTLASDTAARVCVVDLNWWNPGLIACLDPAERGQLASRGRRDARVDTAPISSAIASLVARPGLAQVVAGETSLEEALIDTDLPNLQLLPGGNLPREQRPVLARSAGLRSLIDELASRFDHLVLDIPAVLVSSDAIALATLGEACCLVIRHGVTPTPTVQHALDDLKHLRMLGVILNQVKIETPHWLRILIPQE